jgi:hypothetical protein
VPIGLARALCVVPRRDTLRHRDGWTLRTSHLRLLRHAFKNVDGDPLSGFSSLSEYHQCAPCRVATHCLSSLVRPDTPSEVCSPSTFSQPRGATCPARPTLPVLFRPQGFAPSRRFAPLMTCWVCFIPIPSMGFSLRGLAPPVSPYVLSNAAALLRFHLNRQITSQVPLQGIARHESPAQVLGV